MNVQNNIEVTTKNNYKEFFSLINLKGLLNKNKIDPKEQIIKMADDLLSSGNIKAYFGMAIQGYTPTSSQQKIVDDFIHSIFSKPCNDPYEYQSYQQELYLYIEEQLAKGYKLNNKNLISFLLDHKDPEQYKQSGGIIKSEEFFTNPDYILTVKFNMGSGQTSNHPLPLITQQLRSIMANDTISQDLFKDFKDFLKTKHTDYHSNKLNTYVIAMGKYSVIFEYAPQLLFKNVPSDEFMQISKKFKNKGIYGHQVALFSNAYNTVYVEHLNKIFAETKLNYSSDLIKTLTLENIKTQLTIDKDIPKNALTIIKDVEDIYRKIKQHTTVDNHTDEITQLELILEKRIPEVLTKFLTIDPSYRTSLVSSQGKNAEQLMLESLDNLKQSFHSVYENINQNSVNSLSATNRYTNSIKM